MDTPTPEEQLLEMTLRCGALERVAEDSAKEAMHLKYRAARAQMVQDALEADRRALHQAIHTLAAERDELRDMIDVIKARLTPPPG